MFETHRSRLYISAALESPRVYPLPEYLYRSATIHIIMHVEFPWHSLRRTGSATGCDCKLIFDERQSCSVPMLGTWVRLTVGAGLSDAENQKKMLPTSLTF